MILAIALALAQAATQPVNVLVANADFESPVALTRPTSIVPDGVACGNAEWGHIPNWAAAGQSYGIITWTCDDGAPNSRVAFLSAARMDQLLTEVPRFGVYVLQFDVANWFYSYSGDWKSELYQGNSPAPFCSASGWAMGDMKRQTVTCSLPGGFSDGTSDSLSRYGQGTGNIRIHFENGLGNPALGGHFGWPILVDNVSLTFTPTN